ncbi:MAG: pilus assembly protein PilX [Clostridia bacterium]|nr:pilus assembly protein PilX [Clostridia bacterium]
MIRKINAILTSLILLGVIIHGVFASFGLFGASANSMKYLARGLFVLVALHTAIGIWTTVETLIACKRAGVHYFKGNLMFWARRISGIAIMILLVFHLVIFDVGGERLSVFDGVALTTQILLVVSIVLHVVINAKPMLISFGIGRLKARVADILFILSVLLVVFIAAFIVYYIRWHIA